MPPLPRKRSPIRISRLSPNRSLISRQKPKRRTPDMKRISIVVATALLIVGPALAQSVGEKTGVNSTLGISPTTADFVKEVAISDMFELQSNKLGEERGNAQEKTFAAMMIKDHTKTSDELKALVKSGDVKADLPTQLDSSHQGKLDKLGGYKGDDFTSEF